MNSRQRRLLEDMAQQFGFDLGETARGHARLVHRATGEIVFASGTPSDRRAWKNIRAKLRRVASDTAP